MRADPDPAARLDIAVRRYVEAVERRATADPDRPGYRGLVHEVGVRWSLVHHWQRKVMEARRRVAPGPRAAAGRSSP